jgi:hypothetical protein
MSVNFQRLHHVMSKQSVSNPYYTVWSRFHSPSFQLHIKSNSILHLMYQISDKLIRIVGVK